MRPHQPTVERKTSATAPSHKAVESGVFQCPSRPGAGQQLDLAAQEGRRPRVGWRPAVPPDSKNAAFWTELAVCLSLKSENGRLAHKM